MFSKRRIGRDTAVSEPDPNTYATTESDTNADTCCLGVNSIPMEYTNQTADTYPYSDAYDPIENVPVVRGSTVYDQPNGNKYILILH